MGEPISRKELEARLMIRDFFRDKILRKLDPKSDIIILHCPWDLHIFDKSLKPAILYDHFATRPVTFMFDEIIKYIEPVTAAVLKRDRIWILKKHKELYKKADLVLTNSKFIQEQVRKWFGIKGHVCYPPTDLSVFKPVTAPTRSYFLSVQRVHWQKRIEVQIESFHGLKEKLLVVGGPRDREPHPDLVYLAKDSRNIRVMGGVPHKTLVKLLANAKATIQTGYYEDFGLVAVQSLACGTPVIAVDEGGFKETIHNEQLGVRIQAPYVENLRKAVLEFDAVKYDPQYLRKEAEKYGFDRFRREMMCYAKMAVKLHDFHRR